MATFIALQSNQNRRCNNNDSLWFSKFSSSSMQFGTNNIHHFGCVNFEISISCSVLERFGAVIQWIISPKSYWFCLSNAAKCWTFECMKSREGKCHILEILCHVPRIKVFSIKLASILSSLNMWTHVFSFTVTATTMAQWILCVTSRYTMPQLKTVACNCKANSIWPIEI